MTPEICGYFPPGFAHQPYTFDSFLVGSSNQDAYNAFKHTASSWPDLENRTIFLSSGSGLGKTHLAIALLRQIQILDPLAKLCWTSSENFIRSYGQAKKQGRLPSLRKELLALDGLVLEGTQCLIEHPEVLEAAIRVCKDLALNRKLVILDADFDPTIRKAPDVLAALVQSSQCLRIESPSFDERLKFAKAKYQEVAGVAIEEDLLEFIANHCRRNHREMIGAIYRLEAHCAIYGLRRSVTAAKVVVQL
jgi:chromosomal replication initiator protein